MPPSASDRPPMHLRVLTVLAMRNLRRQLRRTVLTMSAMVVGGALLIVSFALGDGGHETWIDGGVRLGTGHITVEQPEFRVSRRIEHRVPAEVRHAAEAALDAPDIAPLVVARSSKLTVSGLASSAAGARPVQIMAVNPVTEPAFAMIDDQVVEGRYLEPDDRLAAYVGTGLASSLELRIGSRLVVQAQDAEREIAGQLLRVVGIFRSGVPEVDQVMIHMPITTAAEWLGSGHDVTNVGVVLNSSRVVAGVAGRLEAALADPVARGDIRVMEWRESDPALAAAIAIDDFGNYIIHAILFTIIGFGVVNTVLMSVLHRHREFGVLQALGLTPGQTGAIVLIEGLTLTAVSGLAGVALGWWGTWYFLGDGLDLSGLVGSEMTFSGIVIDPVVYPMFAPGRMLQILVFMLVLGVAASIYPALRAARINVAEAMKFDR